MKTKLGFTLIELLVVIAIIAILAAILFPVFTQAKIEGKGTATLSNTKQVGSGHILYANDYDDYSVLAATAAPGSPLTLQGVPYSPWGVLLAPYIKSSQVYQDPLYGFEKRGPSDSGVIPPNILWMYTTLIGYAHMVHSPIDPVNPTLNRGNFKPLSQTAIANPGDTVLYVTKKSRSSALDYLYLGSVIWMANMIAAPVCVNGDTGVNPNSDCGLPPSGWGVGSYPASNLPSIEDGRLTGGFATRKRGLGAVMYSDGHAKFARAEHLAVGTNWTPTRSYTTVRITDITRYMWDAD